MTDIPRNIIFCPRSGLPLAKVEALCSHGWPLLSSLSSSVGGILHPIYGFPLDKLITKLRNELQNAETIEWCAQDQDIQEIKLTISALMYALDCIWQPATDSAMWKQQVPSLPGWAVCAGSGKRFLHLASWYHYATSKRLSFPQYRISKLNENTNWENFGGWLDEAFAIKEKWENGKEALKDAEELKLRTEALLTVKAENIYKRIDMRKVWNWVDIQMKEDKRYPVGRRETFKNIFLSGDLHPEDWTLDDIEDVQVAVLETCDMGNEIMHFIQKRLKHIHLIISEFYSSFTILSSATGSVLGKPGEATQQELDATNKFMEKFDNKVTALTGLPAEPKRENFTSLPLFLKAQAEHRILSRRFSSTQKQADNLPDSI